MYLGSALQSKQGVNELVMCLQLILEKCRFIVKLLSGVGDRLVPFIITDMSLRNVDVRNWSSRVCDTSSVFYIMGGPIKVSQFCNFPALSNSELFLMFFYWQTLQLIFSIAIIKDPATF